MNKFILIILFAAIAYCQVIKNPLLSQEGSDEFRCSLPDVTTADNELDIRRFRSDFAKISEVKFPGLIGPKNERQICKIKCVDGNWLGPLCSPTPIEKIPDGRFTPILRECHFQNQDPLLAVSFNNYSVFTDSYYPHGSEVVISCKHFGLYKLTGDSRLRCVNGVWSSKFPKCVPTSVITNFTDGSPPTIQYIEAAGSAIVELSGELFVYPGSTIWLDCIWPRNQGRPYWSWTKSYTRYAAWASHTGETDMNFRLVLPYVTSRDTDLYTCTSPTGSTNTISIKVVNIECPPIDVSSPHVHLFAQGTRLGNAVHFSCQPGYQLNGSAVLNCMGNGRWSSHPPSCIQTFCPVLRGGGALSVVEYNSSHGGRAVFACAWGYRLVGAPGLECEPDGTWSGDAPRCVPIYCPDPLVPEKGRLLTTFSKDTKYPVGFLIIYTCEDGYEILGESSIVCTENGFWSHPPPFCTPPTEIKKKDTIYYDNTTLVNFEE